MDYQDAKTVVYNLAKSELMIILVIIGTLSLTGRDWFRASFNFKI